MSGTERPTRGDSRPGWSACPQAGGAAVERPRTGAHGPWSAADVVAMGALCELRPPHHDQPATHGFKVSEFLLLSDGERVILHDDRGFTTSLRGGGAGGSIARSELRHDVLNTVLPDDAEETGEAHPWESLATLARARGVDVSADALRQLDYQVVLADDVLEWAYP